MSLAAYGQTLYVTSNDNNQILAYDSQTGAALAVPAFPGFTDPTGVTFGPDGNLYVASGANNNVQKFNPQTGALLGVFTTGGALDEPKGIVFGPDGNLYVVGGASREVLRFNGVTGAFIDIFVAAIPQINSPAALAFGPNRNLYVSDPDNNAVLKFSQTGAFVSTFIGPAVGGLCEPLGLIFKGNSLFVASSGSNVDGDNCGPGGNGSDAVLRYDATTGAFLGNFVASESGGLSNPVGLAFGPDGNLYVASEDGDSILKYDGNTGAFISTIAGGLSGPFYLAFAPSADFQIRYASNLTNGDAVINITNPGSNGASLNGPGFGGAVGNICVNVYAFSPDEQLISCCSCLITPNGLVSLSVNSDLVSNTLTGVRPNSVVIKLVNSAASANFTGTNCTNSAALAGTPAFPLPVGMQAFGTSLHASAAPGSFATTETPFSQATLSPAELASITNRCTNIVGNGSSFGICRSCRAGGLNARK